MQRELNVRTESDLNICADQCDLNGLNVNWNILTVILILPSAENFDDICLHVLHIESMNFHMKYFNTLVSAM